MYEQDHLMRLAQISVFLENRPGALAPIAAALAEAGVNLRALSLADTERFGILRLIADDTDTALATLQSLGVTTKVSDVIGVEVPDRPGALAEVLALFDDTEISLRYMYAELAGRTNGALLIMKLDPADRALAILREAGLTG